MKRELEKRFTDRWPTWFNVDGNNRATLMPFGFEHGDGWFNLVWRLCERLEPVVVSAESETGNSFKVLQVKEKFGGLRFYTNFSNDAVSALIETAEIESFKTCEVCGKEGKRRGTSWITTRCEEHVGASLARSSQEMGSDEVYLAEGNDMAAAAIEQPKTAATEKQAALKAKFGAISAKLATMTDEEQEARVQEIYAMPDAERTDDVCKELYTIMFGDTPQH